MKGRSPWEEKPEEENEIRGIYEAKKMGKFIRGHREKGADDGDYREKHPEQRIFQ